MGDLEHAEALLPSYDSDSYGTVQPRNASVQSTPKQLAQDFAVPQPSIIGRNIGWSSAYIIIISRVIGSGIFAMPGTILKTVGSPGLALLLWIAGALVAWCGLAIAMEYGCMLPRSGGELVYLEFTYKRPRLLASTMVAVQAILLGFTASNCIVFAKYVLFATKQEPTDLSTKLLAVGLLTAITIVHGCFRRTGIWIQNLLGWAKVALILFMILTGLVVVLFRSNDSVDRPAVPQSDGFWSGSDWSWSVVSTAFFKIYYSYAGLDNVNNILDEVKNPVRTLKSVGPAALITCCFTYVLVNLAYLAAVPAQEVKTSGELIAALFFQRVFGSGFGDVFLPLAIAVSAAGNVMVVTFSLARLNQEVARQGFLPFAAFLASTRPFNAPMGGLIVHYIPSVLVIVLPPSADVYAFIADIEGYVAQYYALAIAAGLLLLRGKMSELPRPYKAYVPTVWIRIGLCLALIAAPFFPPSNHGGDVGFFYGTYALVGLSVMIFAVIYWYFLTVALPRWGGYHLESKADILPDGTSVNRLSKTYMN